LNGKQREVPSRKSETNEVLQRISTTQLKRCLRIPSSLQTSLVAKQTSVWPQSSVVLIEHSYLTLSVLSRAHV